MKNYADETMYDTTLEPIVGTGNYDENLLETTAEENNSKFLETYNRGVPNNE